MDVQNCVIFLHFEIYKTKVISLYFFNWHWTLTMNLCPYILSILLLWMNCMGSYLKSDLYLFPGINLCHLFQQLSLTIAYFPLFCLPSIMWALKIQGIDISQPSVTISSDLKEESKQEEPKNQLSGGMQAIFLNSQIW